jgi:predicted nucleic acid-binding Zn ribbon protein
MLKTHCYECGNLIPAYRHFCDQDCMMKFKEKYPNIESTLGVMTKRRKRRGEDHFIKYYNEVGK